MGRRAFVAAAGAMSIAIAPHLARAICGKPPPVHTLPHRGVAVPLNAHVVVTRVDKAAFGDVELMTAPARGAPERTRIDVKRTIDSGRDYDHVELVPAAPLLPRTPYEVWSKGEILGVFTTGDSTDTTAPSWIGPRGGKVWSPPKPSPRPRSNVITLPEECGDAYIELDTDAVATDDQTPESDIRYPVWAGDPKAPLDYTKPPLGWCTIDVERQKSSTLKGHTPVYYLGYGNTVGLDDALAPLPPMRPLKIGVRAVDLAGNASAPSELVLK